jgi:tetratricopeptide (TPR) repeat protein
MKRFKSMRRLQLVILIFFLIGSGGFAQKGILEKFVQKAGVDTVEQKRLEYDFSFSEAAKQKMLGNLNGAKDLYQKCIELRPERSVSYYELASIFYVDGEIEMARAYAGQAIDLDPVNEWYKFIAIEIAVKQERFIDGAKYYKDLYTNFKDENEYRVGEIDMLVRGKDYKNALKMLDALEDKYGYSKYTAIRKKEIFLATGNEKKAYKELEKLIKQYPGEVDIMGILAELYAEKGEEKKALALFNEMKKLNSGNPLVYFSLGKYYFDLGRKAEAIDEFKTGFASKQVNAEIKIQVFIELIRTQTEGDQLNDNLAELLELMYKTDKGNSGIDILYADYVYNKSVEGDKEAEMEAEGIYKRIIKNTPSNFLAWQNLLFIQNSQLDFEEMYSIGNEAVKNFPKQALLLLFKGMGASQTARLEEAIKTLNSGLAVNINNAELTKQFYISLGDTYYQMKNYDAAFSNFENLLALDPDNVIVLNNYSYYLSLLDKDLEKAKAMIEKCVKMEKGNSTYLDTYAWVLFMLEDYGKALEIIEEVISINDDPSGEVFEHYGDILYRNNKKEEAKKAWIKAEAMGEASENIRIKIENGLK